MEEAMSPHLQRRTHSAFGESTSAGMTTGGAVVVDANVVEAIVGERDCARCC